MKYIFEIGNIFSLNLHIPKYIYKCISGARLGVSPPKDLHS